MDTEMKHCNIGNLSTSEMTVRGSQHGIKGVHISSKGPSITTIPGKIKHINMQLFKLT